MFRTFPTTLLLCLLWSQTSIADDAVDPSSLTHLAGHWYVTKAEPA